MRSFRSSGRRTAAALGMVFLGLVAAGCSSSGGSSSSSSAASASSGGAAAPTGSGPVSVLYAGSLVDMMENQIGPAFKTATGYTVNGIGAGSKDLAADIKGKVDKGDVFISASSKVNASLEGASNGNWVSWYATFGTSNVVLGYNPNSKFAADIKSKPWYQVITEPGFKLGFTDPATDPKGELAAEALADTAKSKNLPALNTIAADKGDVFPEETLVGRLQSGQLDAGFFYTVEASAAKIPTVPLTGESDLTATYTVTVLNNAPHEAGAEAFVKYLLGPAGQAVMKKDGLTLVPYTVTGTGVPSSLQSLLS